MYSDTQSFLSKHFKNKMSSNKIFEKLLLIPLNKIFKWITFGKITYLDGWIMGQFKIDNV